MVVIGDVMKTFGRYLYMTFLSAIVRRKRDIPTVIITSRKVRVRVPIIPILLLSTTLQFARWNKSGKTRLPITYMVFSS